MIDLHGTETVVSSQSRCDAMLTAFPSKETTWRTVAVLDPPPPGQELPAGLSLQLITVRPEQERHWD